MRFFEDFAISDRSHDSALPSMFCAPHRLSWEPSPTAKGWRMANGEWRMANVKEGPELSLSQSFTLYIRHCTFDIVPTTFHLRHCTLDMGHTFTQAPVRAMLDSWRNHGEKGTGQRRRTHGRGAPGPARQARAPLHGAGDRGHPGLHGHPPHGPLPRLLPPLRPGRPLLRNGLRGPPKLGGDPGRLLGLPSGPYLRRGCPLGPHAPGTPRLPRPLAGIPPPPREPGPVGLSS